MTSLCPVPSLCPVSPRVDYPRCCGTPSAILRPMSSRPHENQNGVPAFRSMPVPPLCHAPSVCPIPYDNFSRIRLAPAAAHCMMLPLVQTWRQGRIKMGTGSNLWYGMVLEACSSAAQPIFYSSGRKVGHSNVANCK